MAPRVIALVPFLGLLAAYGASAETYPSSPGDILPRACASGHTCTFYARTHGHSENVSVFSDWGTCSSYMTFPNTTFVAPDLVKFTARFSRETGSCNVKYRDSTGTDQPLGWIYFLTAFSAWPSYSLSTGGGEEVEIYPGSYSFGFNEFSVGGLNKAYCRWSEEGEDDGGREFLIQAVPVRYTDWASTYLAKLRCPAPAWPPGQYLLAVSYDNGATFAPLPDPVTIVEPTAVVQEIRPSVVEEREKVNCTRSWAGSLDYVKAPISNEEYVEGQAPTAHLSRSNPCPHFLTATYTATLPETATTVREVWFDLVLDEGGRWDITRTVHLLENGTIREPGHVVPIPHGGNYYHYLPSVTVGGDAAFWDARLPFTVENLNAGRFGFAYTMEYYDAGNHRVPFWEARMRIIYDAPFSVDADQPRSNQTLELTSSFSVRGTGFRRSSAFKCKVEPQGAAPSITKAVYKTDQTAECPLPTNTAEYVDSAFIDDAVYCYDLPFAPYPATLSLSSDNGTSWEGNLPFFIKIATPSDPVRSATPCKPQAVPEAPTVSDVHGRTARLSWAAPHNGHSSITAYAIAASINGSAFGLLVPSTGSPTPSHQLTDLAIGTSFQFKVAAINAVGQAEWSPASDTITTTLVPPVKITPAPNVTLKADREVTLSWTAPSSDGGRAVTRYDVQKAIGAGGTFQDHAAETGVATSLDVTVDPGKTYRFRVAAVTSFARGEWSDAAQISVPAVAPSAPVNLRVDSEAFEGSDLTTTVSWDLPADNGGASIVQYETEYKVATSSEWTPVTPPSPMARSLALSVETNTTYNIRVRARNSVGGGAHATLTHTTRLVTVPSAPRNLRVDSEAFEGSDPTITVSWDLPADNGGASIVQYETEYKVLTSSEWTPVTPPSPMATSLTLTVEANTTYNIRVRALNAVGSGPYATLTYTTKAVSVPSAPVNLRVEAEAYVSSHLALIVGWSPPTDYLGTAVVAYQTEYKVSNSSEWTSVTLPTPLANQVTLWAEHATTYNIRVRARNKDGYGPYAELTYTTKPAGDDDDSGDGGKDGLSAGGRAEVSAFLIAGLAAVAALLNC